MITRVITSRVRLDRVAIIISITSSTSPLRVTALTGRSSPVRVVMGRVIAMARRVIAMTRRVMVAMARRRLGRMGRRITAGMRLIIITLIIRITRTTMVRIMAITLVILITFEGEHTNNNSNKKKYKQNTGGSGITVPQVYKPSQNNKEQKETEENPTTHVLFAHKSCPNNK